MLHAKIISLFILSARNVYIKEGIKKKQDNVLKMFMCVKPCDTKSTAKGQ